MKYTNIMNEVLQDAESRKVRTAEFIVSGENSLKNNTKKIEKVSKKY